jgi:hypothetical protein
MGIQLSAAHNGQIGDRTYIPDLLLTYIPDLSLHTSSETTSLAIPPDIPCRKFPSSL